MKKYLPWIITGLFALWILSALRPPREKTEFNQNEFGRLPVVLNGRVQPFDSVAMNALLMIRGNRTVPLEGNADGGRIWGNWLDIREHGKLEERKWWQFTKHPKKLKPTEWLIEVMMRPEMADQRYVFEIRHPDLLGQLGLENKGVERAGLRYFSFEELVPHASNIGKQAGGIEEAKKDAQLRTPYERDVVHLARSLILYHKLKHSFVPVDLDDFRQSLALAADEVKKHEAGGDYDQALLGKILQTLRYFETLAELAYPLIVPPAERNADQKGWTSVGASLRNSRPGEIHPAILYFASMDKAFQGSRPQEFNRAVADYQQWLEKQGFTEELRKGRLEFSFNQFKPFYKSMAMYIVALLLGCGFWLNWSQWVRRTGFQLVALAFVVHTAGLLFRMFLEGRPPVTNLYSSAVFVGWGAVGLGLILERIYREGIGIVAAGTVGFLTLIIAHHLSLSGDTMEMLQAVLDTNFWLATHVVVITTGYASMFLAGLLAIVYIVRGVLTRSLSSPTAKSLARMVYGIVCFSTLFSFVGTILGGIWADQSWGRFWGWDPKENGALLIVIWCGIILHARWGGMIRERGLMALAVFGNVVTSYSWFGVNMLGIGLHSYGFMDKAFQWLMYFTISQLLFIGLALLPVRFWMSFRNLNAAGARASQGGGREEPAPAGA